MFSRLYRLTQMKMFRRSHKLRNHLVAYYLDFGAIRSLVINQYLIKNIQRLTEKQ